MSIFSEWEKDPEFKTLPVEKKQGILSNYFDSNMVDAEYNSLPEPRKAAIKQNYVNSHFQGQYEGPRSPVPAAPKQMKALDVASLPSRPGVMGTLQDIPLAVGRGAIDLAGMINKGAQTLTETLPAFVTGKDMEKGYNESFFTPGIQKLAELRQSPALAPSKESQEGFARGAISGGFEALLPSMGPMLATAVNPMAGLAATAALFGGGEVGSFLEEARAQGKGIRESVPAALGSGAIEAGGEFLADLLGAKILGLNKATLLPFKTTIKEMLKGNIKKSLLNVLKDMPVEIGTEMAQEAGETAIRKAKGMEAPEPWEAAKDVIGPTMVLTMLFGAGAHGYDAAHRYNLSKNLTNPKADPAARMQAAQEIAQGIMGEPTGTDAQGQPVYDPQKQALASQWQDYVFNRITNKRAVPIEQETEKLLSVFSATQKGELDEKSNIAAREFLNKIMKKNLKEIPESTGQAGALAIPGEAGLVGPGIPEAVPVPGTGYPVLSQTTLPAGSEGRKMLETGMEGGIPMPGAPEQALAKSESGPPATFAELWGPDLPGPGMPMPAHAGGGYQEALPQGRGFEQPPISGQGPIPGQRAIGTGMEGGIPQGPGPAPQFPALPPGQFAMPAAPEEAKRPEQALWLPDIPLAYPAPGKGTQALPNDPTAITGGKPYDSTQKQGVPGVIGEGQKPWGALPLGEAGPQAAAAGGILQEQKGQGGQVAPAQQGGIAALKAGLEQPSAIDMAKTLSQATAAAGKQQAPGTPKAISPPESLSGLLSGYKLATKENMKSNKLFKIEEGMPDVRFIPVSQLGIYDAHTESEQSVTNANDRMNRAASNRGRKRAPITAIRWADGRMEVVDGRATTIAAGRRGEAEVPAIVIDGRYIREEEPRQARQILKRAVEKQLPELNEIIEKIAGKFEGATTWSGEKSIQSLLLKIERKRAEGKKYELLDAKDIVRSSVFYDSTSDIPKLIAELHKIGFEVEARYHKRMNRWGYRGLNSNRKISEGVSGEIQLHSKTIIPSLNKEALGIETESDKGVSEWDIKNASEAIYAKWRNVNIRTLKDKERAAYFSDRARSQKLWDTYLLSIPAETRALMSASESASASSIIPPVIGLPSVLQAEPSNSYAAEGPDSGNQTNRPSSSLTQSSSLATNFPESSMSQSPSTLSIATEGEEIKPLNVGVQPQQVVEKKETVSEKIKKKVKQKKEQAAAPPKAEEQAKTISEEELDAMLAGVVEETKQAPKTVSERVRKQVKAKREGKPQPKAHIKKAGIESLEGAKEAIAALSELFGAKSNKLSAGITFDDESYQKALPHFQKAWEHAKAAGYELKQFIKEMVDLFGENIAPYVKRFVLDQRQGLETEKKDAILVSGEEQQNEDASIGIRQDQNDRGGLEGQGPGNIPAAEGERGTAELPRGNARDNGPGLRGGMDKEEQPSTQEGSRRRTGKSKAAERSREPSDRKHVVNVSGIHGPGDYRIKPGELAREGSWKETAARNLDIIELVHKLDAEGRKATPEEQANLVKYVGWGASEVANNLFPRYVQTGEIDPDYAREGWKELAQRAKDILTPEELKTAARSTQYAHYTSEEVITAMYQALERMGFPGGKVLDFGAGIGHFAGLVPESMTGITHYTGVEMDHVTAAIARHLYQNQSIREGDFTKESLPDNFYDLATGNPPFKSGPIFADPKYAKLRFPLHDFAIAKQLDKVHPGGLLAFVTSHYTMDKQGDKMRKYLQARADFIGAMRLPQTAFKENAGTEVVTDILFFRKRKEGEQPGGEAWSNIVEVQTPEGPAQINEYFANNPNMVLGKNSLQGSMYGKNEYTVLPADEPIADLLQRAVEKMPQNIYSMATRSPQDQTAAKIERDYNPTVKKEGNIYVDDKGLVRIVQGGTGAALEEVFKDKKGNPIKIDDQERKWLSDYVGLRDLLKATQYDQLNDGNWEESLKALNTAYDAFVKKHGYVNEFIETDRTIINEDGQKQDITYRRYKNKKLLRFDVESVLVRALEKEHDDGRITKSKLLTQRTIQKPTRQKPTNINDALMTVLDETGKLDLDRIAGELGLDRDTVIEQLGNLIYEAPGGDWQTSDEYLSGDVVKKLEDAKTAAKIDKKYERNIEALEKVQPEPLQAKDITVVLGAPWVEPGIVKQFAEEAIGINTTILFDPPTNTWTVVGAESRRSRDAGDEWGTQDRSPFEILQSALNKTKILVTHKDSDGKTYTDQAATAAANDLAKRMKERFSNWIWTDAERAGSLLKIYNQKYNNLANRKFNGEHLTLPGLSLNFSLHDHSKRAIWRIIQTGNTYLAHAVGGGKTLQMIVSGMEMKRLGLIEKPMYVVPIAVLPQFAKEFQSAYPLANIMVADETNFTGDNRRRFMAQAALNKPDAIVISHSAFGLIGMKEENIAAVREEMVDQLREQLSDLKEEHANYRLIKKVERAIEDMEQRFDGMIAGDKDAALSLEEMGADFLFVDEAHEFRKLDYGTNQKLKGIDPKGSRKSIDLYAKIQWLEKQRPGRSHVFASGTPITNTMGELYTLMKFFDHGEMEKDGIKAFDAWASMFGQAGVEPELNSAGRYEFVERFSRFINIPELGDRVRQYMDVLTSSDLGALVDRPKIVGGNPEIVVTQPSQALKDYLNNVLAPRLEESKKWKPSKEEPNNPDPIIAIIADGRLASIDMRFVDNKASGEGSKLSMMVGNIIDTYHSTKDAEYVDDITGEIDKKKGSGQIVFYNNGLGAGAAENRGFDARKWMMQQFKKGGVNLNEVAWIADYDSAAKKAKLFKAVKDGSIRILIGSAKKMGTGLNVQKRLIEMHYLDAPWYPSDVEQPDGRILRTGNQNPYVSLKRYATKGSYDSTMWQMVARKARFIEQFLKGDKSIRTIDDVSESSNYAMAAALSSGDERIIRLVGLQNELERLALLQSSHHSEQAKLGSQIRSTEFEISSTKKYISDLEAAAKTVGNYVSSYDITGETGGKKYTGKEHVDFGKALIAEIEKAIPGEAAKAVSKGNSGNYFNVEVGKINGFPVTLNSVFSFGSMMHRVKIKVADITEDIIPYEKIANGKVENLDVVRRAVNVLNEFDREVDRQKDSLKEYNLQLKKYQARLGAPFEYERDLAEKTAELAQLQAELIVEGETQEAIAQQAQAIAAIPEEDLAEPQGQEPEQEAYSTDEGPGNIGPEMIKSLFNGQDVQDIGGDEWKINLKNGKSITISMVPEISGDKTSFKVKYGRAQKRGEKIVGKASMYEGNETGFISLVKDAAGELTLAHESFHILEFMGIVSPHEINIIKNRIRQLVKEGKFEPVGDDIGGVEDRARFMAKLLTDKNPTGVMATIARKIWDFVDRIKNLLGTRTPEGVARDILSGKAYNRQAQGVSAEEAYATTAALSAMQKKISWTTKDHDWSAQGLKDLAAKVYTKFLMEEYPIVRFGARAGRKYQEELENQIRRIRGKGGIAEDVLAGAGPSKLKPDGTVTHTGSPSLKDILKPISSKTEYRNYESMRVAMRDLALSVFRPDIVGTNPADDLVELARLAKEYQGATTKVAIGNHVINVPTKLLEISREHRKFETEAVLDPLHEIGWLSDETYDKIIQAPEGEFYASFMRQMEEAENYVVGSGGSPVKRITGTERDLKYIPSVEGTIANVQRTIRMVEQTRLNKQIVELRNASPEYAALITKVPGGGLIAPKGTLMVPENGKKTYWKVPEEVKNAVDAPFTPNEMSTVIKLLNYPTKLLRAGATLSAEFIARNPVRDQFSAMVYSKYNYMPFYDLAKGIFHLLKKDALYDEYMASGAAQSYFISVDRDSTEVRAKNLTGHASEGFKWSYLNPLKPLQILSEYSELGTRLGAFAKAKAKGATSLQAMAEAREITLDFRRMGQEKALNQIIAFWNANIQGTDKMVRSFKQAPAQTMFKVLAGITAPSILLWFLNKDDDRYKELPDWQKNFFWIFPVGTDGPIIRIPKPFELGIIFGSGPERVLDWIYNKDPEALAGIAKAIGSGATPGLIPTALVPVLESMTNYSFFMGRKLENMGVSRLSPGMRTTPFTSQIAADAGKLTDVSPIMMENWVRGWTGTLGAAALRGADKAYQKAKGSEIPEVSRKWYEEAPGIKGFISKEGIGGGSKTVERFYNVLEKTSQAKADYDTLKRSNPEEARAYRQKHFTDIRFAHSASLQSRRLNNLRKRRARIMSDSTMDSETKREQIDKIERLASEIAARFMRRYDSIE